MPPGAAPSKFGALQLRWRALGIAQRCVRKVPIPFATRYLSQPDTFRNPIPFATRYLSQPDTFRNPITFATRYLWQPDTFRNPLTYTPLYRTPAHQPRPQRTPAQQIAPPSASRRTPA